MMTKVVFRYLKPFLITLVSEEANRLIQGDFSRNLAQRFGVSDEVVDSVIRSFADALIESIEKAKV
jgi:hypothetical protein